MEIKNIEKIEITYLPSMVIFEKYKKELTDGCYYSCKGETYIKNIFPGRKDLKGYTVIDLYMPIEFFLEDGKLEELQKRLYFLKERYSPNKPMMCRYFSPNKPMMCRYFFGGTPYLTPYLEIDYAN